VTLTLKDGRKIERSKYYATGSVQVPMSPARIKAKFVTAQEVYLEALWRITPYGENLSGFAGLGR